MKNSHYATYLRLAGGTIGLGAGFAVWLYLDSWFHREVSESILQELAGMESFTTIYALAAVLVHMLPMFILAGAGELFSRRLTRNRKLADVSSAS